MERRRGPETIRVWFGGLPEVHVTNTGPAIACDNLYAIGPNYIFLDCDI